jgi:hypothetical protein
VVVLRTLYNYIECESNRHASCHPHHCHTAELDGKGVRDDQLYMGAPLLDDVTLGKGCSMRSRPSSCLTGAECTHRNEWRSVGVLFDEEMVAGCRSTLCSIISSFTEGNCWATRGGFRVAVLARLDELRLDEGRLSVRRNEGWD